ncbi:ComEC/Rec2 family competence protein [uncultured Corynebacterium sp.]|uniref:ComEC/Rec2 family competence protein n=1 Tax=uncultured Corynebacterium sp. TaxID=159447 RepID=UPI00261961D9|nr:ComEC/Rec2 family competence protein [uncultured Corynebacterium sp.]
MSELRLVPAALVVWAVAIAVIVAGPVVALGIIAVAVVGCVVWREPGQAILCGGLGACSSAVAWVRCMTARGTDFGEAFTGTVAGAPKQLDSGDWFVRVNVEGYPVPVPVFTAEVPGQLVSGTPVEIAGEATESTRPGVGAVTVEGAIDVLGQPTGFAAFAAAVRDRFSTAVEAVVGEHAQGLIPGMVVGDVSLQSPEEQQAYIDTGLSHLSAVSGANCMYVAAAALLVSRLCRFGLRVQIATAGCALLVYAGLVGPEPSVLRATVSGLVGFTAVVSSTRTEPIHALCLSIIGLVLVDSDLAVNYAFALSTAATAGIVAISPLIYRALAPLGWPDIVAKVVSVAAAADLATAPIIAGMAGKVSLVAVVANVLVSPVVGAVTVLGMAAAILAQLHTALATPLLWVVQPLAGWVRTVAETGASLPSATVQARPIEAAVFYGWVLAGFIAHKPRITLTCAVLIVSVGVMGSGEGKVDVDKRNILVVDREEDIGPLPPGTTAVAVREGTQRKRPVVTQDGIPVIYPYNDQHDQPSALHRR